MIEEQDRAFRESLIADQEKVGKINNGINSSFLSLSAILVSVSFLLFSPLPLSPSPPLSQERQRLLVEEEKRALMEAQEREQEEKEVSENFGGRGVAGTA